MGLLGTMLDGEGHAVCRHEDGGVKSGEHGGHVVSLVDCLAKAYTVGRSLSSHTGRNIGLT